MYLTKATHRGTAVNREPDETATRLSADDYRRFEDIFEEWMDMESPGPGHVENYRCVGHGNTGDVNGLADRVFRWASQLLIALPRK
jgi:hypothetical protein